MQFFRSTRDSNQTSSTPKAADFRRDKTGEDSESASSESGLAADAGTRPVRSRRAQVWPFSRAERAERTTQRNVLKDTVLLKMNEFLGLISHDRRAAHGRVEEISQLARSIWKDNAPRQEAKLRSYFVRILTHLDKAERDKLSDSQGFLPRSPVKFALEAALRAINRGEATQPGAVTRAGSALVDRFRSVRSRLTLMRDIGPQQRVLAAQREMGRQAHAVFGALRAGNPGRAASLLNKSVPLLQAIHGGHAHPATLNGELYAQLTHALHGMTRGQLEAIAVCGPTALSPQPDPWSGTETRSNVLARSIADVLFVKRVNDPKAGYGASQLAVLAAAASDQALLALDRAAANGDGAGHVDAFGPFARAAGVRQACVEAVGASLCDGLSRLANEDLAGMLHHFREAAGVASALGPVQDTLALDEVTQRVSGHVATLPPARQVALRQWMDGDQFQQLLAGLERTGHDARTAALDTQADPRWQSVRQLLGDLAEQVKSAATVEVLDTTSGAQGRSDNPTRLDFPLDAVPRAFASLGFDRSSLAAAESSLMSQAAEKFSEMDKAFALAQTQGFKSNDSTQVIAFNVTKQAVRDMVAAQYRIKVDADPEVQVKAAEAGARLIIVSDGVAPRSIASTDNLGVALGAPPELLKKALYFATQEVIALFETPMTLGIDSPMVGAMDGPFSFFGDPQLKYTVTIDGDAAMVEIDYARGGITNVAEAATQDIIEMDPARSYMRLYTRYRVSLEEPTQFVPGATTLNFSLVRSAGEVEVAGS